ncbi:hypothetical protein FUA23_20175 [Neolewinella aurantiaca]|uniref:Uncharacterized protein n=1 Tax=Neolewinella aurantiaca TaxID=2602767 RepID=A0A5C7F8R1_9BACT|nr:hypothetical protein [Neolewinella aurantiaca]TXF85980.1 hypothetical protein FUA23_20175 [Neolewinella aurantiaca]
MKLFSVSRTIFLLALLFLALAGFFPSPLTIGLAATAFSALALWQTYAILRDDSAAAKRKGPTVYEGYQNE